MKNILSVLNALEILALVIFFFHSFILLLIYIRNYYLNMLNNPLKHRLFIESLKGGRGINADIIEKPIHFIFNIILFAIMIAIEIIKRFL